MKAKQYSNVFQQAQHHPKEEDFYNEALNRISHLNEEHLDVLNCEKETKLEEVWCATKNNYLVVESQNNSLYLKKVESLYKQN